MIVLWNGAKTAVGTAGVRRDAASGVPWYPARLRSESRRGDGSDEHARRAGAGDRGATGSHLPAERRHRAHQRKSRPRNRPARGDGRRPFTARCGAIAILDEAGQPEAFVTSDLTEEQRRRLAGWPDGLRFSEHVRGLRGPLRIADVPAYVRSLRFVPDQGLPTTLFLEWFLGMGFLDAVVDKIEQANQETADFSRAGSIDDFRLRGSRPCRHMGGHLTKGGASGGARF